MLMRKKNIEKATWYNKFYKNKISRPKSLSPWNKMISNIIQNLVLYEKGKKLKLLDIGCGTGQLLTYLAINKIIDRNELYGVDLSRTAISKITVIPKNNLKVVDIEKYGLPMFPSNYFDIIVMAEVIEHLDNPIAVIDEIHRLLKNGGYLIISFPNYLNFPWLVLRMLAEKLNRPEWIVLQPVDKIYTFFKVKKMIESRGFRLIKVNGTVFFPPILYKYETEKIANLLNKLKFSILSFHPVMIFKKA